MGKKIVVVNAGPRKGWNTDILLTEAAKGAEEGKGVTMNKLKNKKLFVLVSALVIMLDCVIDILLLRAFWKKSEE